jgi:nitrile hydratase
MTDKDRHSDSHHHADHDHADAGSSALSDIALRVRALEDLLVERAW